VALTDWTNYQARRERPKPIAARAPVVIVPVPVPQPLPPEPSERIHVVESSLSDTFLGRLRSLYR